MNEAATIKIWSNIQGLERKLQQIYTDYFGGYYEEDVMIKLTNSTERDLEIHYYIYNLILKDANTN